MAGPARPSVRFVVPKGLGYASGGTVYNTRLAEALTGLGIAVEVVGVPGAWPVGTPEDRARLAAALAVRLVPQRRPAHDAAPTPPLSAHARLATVGSSPGPVPVGRTRPDPTLASGVTVDGILVDSLLGLGAPEEIRVAACAAGQAGTVVGLLVHMSLADASGLPAPEAARLAALEREALAAAPVVLVPSEFAARRLAERYGRPPHVARPGVVRVPEAVGSFTVGAPPHILCLAALLPGKGQLRLVHALAAVRDRPWTATLAGYDGADPAYARSLRDTVAKLALAERVRVPGELRGDALEAEWARTDLTVLASESETFGLAVAESLARGIPAVVAGGTGAVEALGLSLVGGLGPAGAVAGPAGDGQQGLGDPLARELAGWLDEAAVRARWRAAALAARPLLPGWEATGRAVLLALSGQRDAPAASGA
ncbi:glycosyltransferase family 4 protein [Sinomonas notoginsengisoli]